jgi:hypothetical protein
VLGNLPSIEARASSFLATNYLTTRLNQVNFMTIVRQDGGGWPVQLPTERDEEGVTLETH